MIKRSSIIVKRFVFSSLFFVSIFLFSIVSAQDPYYDGNYSNGEYIDFLSLGKHVFVQGDITEVLKDEKRASLEIKINSEAIVKSFLSNMLTIKKKGILTFYFLQRKEEGKNKEKETFFFKYSEEETSRLRLTIKTKNQHITFTGSQLEIKKGQKIILSLVFSSPQIEYLNIEIGKEGLVNYLDLWNRKESRIVEGHGKINKNGKIRITESEYGFFDCPDLIEFVDGGFFNIKEGSTIINTEGRIIYHGMLFYPKKPLLFKVEKIDMKYGCLQDLPIRKVEKSKKYR
ncbi:hypothetical protein B6U82_01755, partial [Candidatus Pacearchaeota archaeon ex4484_31]